MIGMSCSVRSRTSPWARLVWAAMAEVRPATRGAASLARVHRAATPMTPAPMKRTSLAQTVMASSSAGAPAGRLAAIEGTPWAAAQAMNSGEVRMGTKISQARTRPNNWVRPTARPIR
ncbi:hypothetical protein D3C71_1576640 [compost metagenome]